MAIGVGFWLKLIGRRMFGERPRLTQREKAPYNVRERGGHRLGIAVLLFGGKKIPEVAKGLGEGIRNFKTALKDDASKPTSQS